MKHDEETMKKVRQRVAASLLAELRSGEAAGWYYISMVHVPTNTFRGGYFLFAQGPTDAWCKMHHLNWCEQDCETNTLGPATADTMLKVPDNMRWRKLTEGEVIGLGS